jgi:hypothetical protein
LAQFYDRLLTALRQTTVRDGQWRLLERMPAWNGNWTSDCFLSFAWEGAGAERMLVAVNYAGNQSQCYVRLPLGDLAGRSVKLNDLMNPVSYDRSGSDLVSKGLYLDLPAWEYHVFGVTCA